MEIITASHDVDSPEWEHKSYGLKIADYVWIATNALILPSCSHIGYGAVVGAGSVCPTEVKCMEIVAGNPARKLRERKAVHTELVVESLLGGDYRAYKAARKCSL